MPTANAEGYTASEGSVGEVAARRVFRLRFGPAGGHGGSPSACSETPWRKKKDPRDLVLHIGVERVAQGVPPDNKLADLPFFGGSE